MDELDMTELIELIKSKKDLLNEMLLLSDKQAKVIANEEFEKLEGILGKKDKIIARVDEIDLKAKALNDGREIKNDDLLKLLSDMKKIINDISVLDDQNNKNLAKAMSNMTHEIKDMREGVKAMENYGNSDPYQAFVSQGNSLFIDQDS